MVVILVLNLKQVNWLCLELFVKLILNKQLGLENYTFCIEIQEQKKVKKLVLMELENLILM